MKKLMAVAAACLLAACNSGTVTGPDPVDTVTQAPEPVAAATPAPQPVAGGPTTAFELSCGSGSTLSVKYNGPASRATIETFYTSFDNQDLVFGKQSHTVNAGDSVTRTFGACQQGDADQPGVKLIGGCFFDKNGDPFNPKKSPEKVTECRTPTPQPTPTPSPSPSPTPEPTCQQLNPQAGLVTKSILKETWVSSGSLTETVRYYNLDNIDDGEVPGYSDGNSNDDDDREWYCENNGGEWLNSFSVPGVGNNGAESNVCRKVGGIIPTSIPGDHNDISLYTTIAGSDTRKYSVKVTLTWSIAAGAAQSKTFKIVYNGDFVKKQVTVQTACGQAKSGTLVWGQGDQYNNSPNYAPNDGHVTGNYAAVVQ